MITSEETVVISSPVDVVFDFVANPANDSKWQFDVLDGRMEGQPGIGATIKRNVKFLGSREVIFEVTGYESNRRIEQKAVSGAPMGMKPRIILSTESLGSGTKLVRRVEIEPHGLGKLMAPMMKSTVGKYNSRFLVDLKKVLET